jgi:hypothetical protein
MSLIKKCYKNNYTRPSRRFTRISETRSTQADFRFRAPFAVQLVSSTLRQTPYSAWYVRWSPFDLFLKPATDTVWITHCGCYCCNVQFVWRSMIIKKQAWGHHVNMTTKHWHVYEADSAFQARTAHYILSCFRDWHTEWRDKIIFHIPSHIRC